MRRSVIVVAVFALVLPLGGPVPAYEPQNGGFLEPHGGSSGRTAARGVHAAGGDIAWTSRGLGDLDGPMMLTRDGQVITWVSAGTAVWDMLLLDAATGSVSARITDVVAGCAAVDAEGMIWTQSSDTDSIHVIDPADGSTTRTLPSPVGSCEQTMQFVDDDVLALGESCCSERIHLITTTDDSARAVPDEAVRSRVILSSEDGSTLYTIGAGLPLQMLSINLSTGVVIDRQELPGSSLGSDPAQRFIVMPGGRIIGVTDAATFAVEDDGRGGLSLAWAVDETDDVGPPPATLYPVNDDIVAGWQSFGAADTLLGLRVSDGQLAFRTPAVEGASGGVASRSGITDADGNIILPQIISRNVLSEGTSYLYDVFDAAGIPTGTSPSSIGSGVGGMALGDDGTLFVRTSQDDAEVVMAIRDTLPGAVDIPTTVTPGRVGAGIASLTFEGRAVATADRLVLRRGGDTRYATPIHSDGVPYRKIGRFALGGAAVGEWRAAIEDGGIVTDTGLTVQVEAPDDKVALDLDLSVPGAVRNGRTGAVSLTVRNTSNIDGVGVPVVLAVELGADDPRQLIPAFNVNVGTDDAPEQGRPRVVQGEFGTRTVFITLDHVPANGSRRVPFVLDVPNDAPDTGVVNVRAAVPECHAEDGVTFDQPASDPCIAIAARTAADGALGEVGSGMSTCLAMNLSGLITPTVQPDGSIRVPGRPSGSDVNGVMFDCFTGAVVSAGGLPGPATILAYEGIAFNVGISYLDCRLDEALEGTGAAGGGSGSGPGYGPGYRLGSTATGSSVDPNEMQGPLGGGAEHWINTADPFEYRVLFENLPGAAFAAQEVTITTTLDPGLDPTTLQFGQVGFSGDLYDLQAAAGQTLITPAGADHRVLVTTARDGATLRWHFSTLGRTTVGPPADDTIGFLPPNDTPPAGDGFVTFAVHATATDGQTVAMQASIVFDTNEPIITNTWSNRIDNTPPTAVASARPDVLSDVNSHRAQFEVADAQSGVASVVIGVGGLQPRIEVVPPDRGVVMLGARESSVSSRITPVDRAGNVGAATTDTVAIAANALDRLAGPTRVETSVEVARAAFRTAPLAVIARADNYPDSLAGATLARYLDAPVLLTNRNTVPGILKAALRDLGTARVLLLGGTSALTPDVTAQLREMGITVERVSGPTRYGTAAQIAALLPGSPSHAFVIEGANADAGLGWAEALVVAPWAARVGEPMLLVEANRLPAETADAITDLGIESVTIVGGTARVSGDVADQIEARGVEVTRIGTDDRYETSVEVAQAAIDAGVLTPDFTWVATGEVFADALAAGAAAARTAGPLLLVHPTDVALSRPATDQIRVTEADILVLRISGGDVAVSADVEAAIRAALTR